MTYEELLTALFPRLTGGIRWGLERTERLLAEVGNPHRSYRTIHIGGTNGKGSVAVTVAAVLREAGLRTGLYTSPHLCSYRERVQIDGVPVARAEIVAAAEALWPAIEREQPSFFEATTAIGFLVMARARADVAVVEVGLGGRLDATNVVEPEVVVVTNVALDHMEYLGSSLESIAREKAGIIKPGVPVVTAVDPGAARDTLAARARDCGAPFIVVPPPEPKALGVGRDGTAMQLQTETWGELGVRSPLIGEHQAGNIALAVRALELLPEPPTADAVRAGVRGVRWPGRLQVERMAGRDWVFDVAHNPAGVGALLKTLRMLELARPVVAVVGILADKDWTTMVACIRTAAEYVILTVPETAPAGRRWDPQAVAAGLSDPAIEAEPRLADALRRAARRAPGGTVLVTGSFHTVGDALAMLRKCPHGADSGLPPPTDVV